MFGFEHCVTNQPVTSLLNCIHGRRHRGAGGPCPSLDFYTWYFSIIFAIFQSFLLLFGLFSVTPTPLEEA